MHLVNSITAMKNKIAASLICILIGAIANGQDNSPYSRYGVGDQAQNNNILNRAMGGISAGYSDYQSINLTNPASLGNVQITIFDFGAEIVRRTLKSNISPQKYTSTNTNVSYLQIGFPLGAFKAKKSDREKNIFWGGSFGLRPVTRIGYKIQDDKRVPGLDSVNNLYEGTGGLNQVNFSTGLRVKNLSVGVSAGYTFGNNDYSTKVQFVNDSIAYYRSYRDAQTRFGGLFVTVGTQYQIKLKGDGLLKFGAYANLQQNLRARRDILDATFAPDNNGGDVIIDTVSYKRDEAGTLEIPMSYAVGFTYANTHILVGADVEIADWKNYTSYNQKDPALQNSFTVRAGVQYYPAVETTPTSKYWSFVKYRAGIYYGSDYVKITNNRTIAGATLGAGFPLTSFQRLRFGDFVTLNTAVDLGIRGSKKSESIRENITRFSIGISMNARWFQKRKYD